MIGGTCEICGQNEASELINVGIDVGFHLGNYAKDKILYKRAPVCIEVSSIYFCRKCQNKLTRNKFFPHGIKIMAKLKEIITKDWIKLLMLDNLKTEVGK